MTGIKKCTPKRFGPHGETDGAEHADDTENGGGKTDKEMVRTMNQHIDKGCDCCTDQHGKESDAVAGEVKKEM